MVVRSTDTKTASKASRKPRRSYAPPRIQEEEEVFERVALQEGKTTPAAPDNCGSTITS